MGSSYRHYREYQGNRYQYKMEQITVPIVMMIVIGFFTKYYWIIIVGVVMVIVVKGCKMLFQSSRQNQATCENIKSERNMEGMKSMKTTERGYLNKNNQKNNGRTDKPGTDFGQWFYDMECMNCGQKYYANGTDIWQRKCPKCQGGKP